MAKCRWVTSPRALLHYLGACLHTDRPVPGVTIPPRSRHAGMSSCTHWDRLAVSAQGFLRNLRTDQILEYQSVWRDVRARKQPGRLCGPLGLQRLGRKELVIGWLLTHSFNGGAGLGTSESWPGSSMTQRPHGEQKQASSEGGPAE